MMVEVDLNDSMFNVADGDLNLGYLLCRVKRLAVSEVIECSCLARLAIIQSEAD